MADEEDFMKDNTLREAVLKTFEKYLECYEDKGNLYQTSPESFGVKMEDSMAKIGELLPIEREKIEMITHHMMRGIDGIFLDDPAPTLPKEYLDLVEEALQRYKNNNCN